MATTAQTRNAHEAQGLSGYPRKRGTEPLHGGRRAWAYRDQASHFRRTIS